MTIGIDISVLNDRQKTGIATYAYNLIDALLKRSSEDRFILFGIATLGTYDYLKELPFKNYRNVDIKVFKLPAKTFRTAFLLWQKLNWPNIDSLIGHVDIFHTFNWYFPPQKEGKKIATVFDMTPLTHPQWHQYKTTQLDKIRIDRIAKKADLIITISNSTKKDFLSFYPGKKIEVVYPAAAENFGKRINAADADKILTKYQLKPGFILSVSTIEPRKNLKRLIQAYLETGINHPLVLVGGLGWKNQDVIELAAKNNDRVRMVGFVPDEQLPAFYQQASCFIYPSLYEGFGIPVLEAMESGVPVVCSKTSSLPEVGKDAVIYLDPLNIEDISKVLKMITSKPNLRRQLISKGYKQAENFSWKASAEKLNDLYHNLE